MKDFVKKLLVAAIFAWVIINSNVLVKGISMLNKIIFPLVLGAVIAFILNIIVVRLEKLILPNTRNAKVKNVRRAVCIVLSMVIIVAIMVAVVIIVVPELGNSISIITKEAPTVVNGIIDWIDKNAGNIPELDSYLAEIQESWPQIVNSVSEYVKNAMSGLFSSVMGIIGAITSGVIDFIVALIFAIYILAGKEKLAQQISKLLKAYLPDRKIKSIYYVCGTVNDSFSNFIVGQCTEAVIIGALCVVCMIILGFPYAVMTGIVVGVTALIPMIGAYIGAFVGAFMIFTVNPLQALFFLIFIIVLQQVEGNLIYPRVVGSSIGLPGMWVLVAVTIGAGIGGVAGMLIGVPVLASAYKLLSADVSKRLDNCGRRRNDENRHTEENSDKQENDEKQEEQEKEERQENPDRRQSQRRSSRKKRRNK